MDGLNQLAPAIVGTGILAFIGLTLLRIRAGASQGSAKAGAGGIGAVISTRKPLRFLIADTAR